MEAMDAFAVEVSYLSDAEKKKKVSCPTHASTRAQRDREKEQNGMVPAIYLCLSTCRHVFDFFCEAFTRNGRDINSCSTTESRYNRAS